MKTERDKRPLIARLWTFQAERAPVIVLVTMASLTVGVFATFAHFSLQSYIVSVMIVYLYLIQTRTSDEKKDFEHDNQFHPNRPVQRGVVSLDELAIIGRVVIVSQLVLYASFGSIPILLFGFASQAYAFLTRKEFFVREWLRNHFFTYYFTHYIQLVILNFAILNIINPANVPFWQLAGFMMLNTILIELGRKMFATEDDTTDDTFSAQLGHKGSALAFALFGLTITLSAYYFISQNAHRLIFVIAPVLALGFVINSAYHYAIESNRANAKNVEYSAALLVITGMLSVILG